MIPSEEDRKRRKQAEDTKKFLDDQARQIEYAAVEAEANLRPIRRRGAQNHYLEEAMDLLDRRRRRGK